MSASRRSRRRREPIAVADRLGRYRPPSGAPGSELAALQAAWEAAAGRETAANSVVVRRSRAGVVNVACASAMWASELTARRDLLADQLAAAVPGVPVTGLRFVVSDHAIPVAEPTEPAPAPAGPTASDLADAAALVGEVSDPSLRDLLTRAAAGQMATSGTRPKSLQNGKKRGRVDRPG